METLFVFILIFELSRVAAAVKCYKSEGSSLTTCEGDFCVAVRPSTTYLSPHQTCVSGAKKPSYACSLDYWDALSCFCDTDYCNSHVVFRSNVSVQPIVECKEVAFRQYVPVACNICSREMKFVRQVGISEERWMLETVGCVAADSGDFIFDPEAMDYERITRNFYSPACYNISMHREHYHVFCRCAQTNCNSPETTSLPFPIDPSSMKISCFTSGMAHSVDPDNVSENENLKKMSNDSFSDEESECTGQFCFVAVSDHPESRFYKGCISANEHGANKIQLGFSYLNDVSFYICNANFCNSDIETALFEAENSTIAASDNVSGNTKTLFFLLVPLVLVFVRI